MRLSVSFHVNITFNRDSGAHYCRTRYLPKVVVIVSTTQTNQMSVIKKIQTFAAILFLVVGVTVMYELE